jgi:ferredoxin-NADP reductase
MATQFQATLIEKADLTPSIFWCKFATENPEFTYIPGQFVHVYIPSANNQIHRRSYSIASARVEKGSFELCIKHVEGGIGSVFLHNLQMGDQITGHAPQGHFVVKNKQVPIVFIATGTGIAPFRSMLAEAPHAQVWFGMRTQQELFWLEELTARAAQLHVTLSQADETWTGLRGRVTAHISSIVQNDPATHYYVCGTPPMVLEMRKALIASGVSSKNIFFELFT